MSFLDFKMPVAIVDSLIEDIRKQVGAGTLKTSKVLGSDVDPSTLELNTLVKILRTELKVCSNSF